MPRNPVPPLDAAPVPRCTTIRRPFAALSWAWILQGRRGSVLFWVRVQPDGRAMASNAGTRQKKCPFWRRPESQQSAAVSSISPREAYGPAVRPRVGDTRGTRRATVRCRLPLFCVVLVPVQPIYAALTRDRWPPASSSSESGFLDILVLTPRLAAPSLDAEPSAHIL